MAISNYGELKAEVNALMFHQRFVPNYDNAVLKFEASANRRLKVLPMETSALLTTVLGEVALPIDYLLWRTIKPTTRPYEGELEYVHPAYLPAVSLNRLPRVFTIENNTLKVRPIDDTGGYNFHYYCKIPTIVGADTNTNWLLTAQPDVYVEGMLTELGALGRNWDFAQLHKARRDELLQEIKLSYALTTGATSSSVRTADYF